MARDYANSYMNFNIRFLWIVLLIITWICGFLLGYFFCEPLFSPLMRSAVVMPVSIVGLFSCMFFPLICSFFSILLNHPIFVYIVCFFNSVAFGFSCCVLSQLFGSAAWLMCILFLFSDTCFGAIFLFLWLRRLYDPMIRGYHDFGYCIIICIGIAFADIFIISPFLQGLV